MSRSISEINEIETAIIKVICYFDIFNYPLKITELQQWFLSQTINQEDLKKNLTESDFLKDKISQKEEFYFLKGREEIIRTRKEREIIALEKIAKAKKICQWLLRVNPFIKGIAICNDLGYVNAPEKSDIDLFIISRKNRIWLARFLLVFPLKLFGLRPTIKTKKDKICASFFITEDKLNLKEIMLPDVNGMPDIYFIYWLCHLYFIYPAHNFPMTISASKLSKTGQVMCGVYGKDNIWPDFYQANNWLKSFLPNFIEPQNIFLHCHSESAGEESYCSPLGFFAEPALSEVEWVQNDKENLKIRNFARFFYFIDCLEKFCRWFQLKILPKSLKEKNGQGLEVIINDQMLKFHNLDKREYYRRILLKRLIRVKSFNYLP